MPPKFRKGDDEDKDRVHLLGLDSSDEEEEEIFLNSSPTAPHHSARNHHDPKIRQVQNQVTGVIGIMRDNINKVLDRGEKLEHLEEKSEELADSATHFRHSSRRLQQKAWWQQCRLKLILAAIILIILVVIIIIIVTTTRKK